MYKECKTERSFARQRELEEGFLDYLDTVSFFNMEVADLCRFLNIPRKTFYRYFGSKEDALYALVDHRLQDLNHLLEDSFLGLSNCVRDDLCMFFRFWKSQRRFLDILTRNYLGIIIIDRATQQQNLTLRMSEVHSRVSASEKDYQKDFLISGAMSMIFHWHMNGYKESEEAMVDLATRLYSIPLREILEYEY